MAEKEKSRRASSSSAGSGGGAIRIAAILFGAILLDVSIRGTQVDSASGAGDGKGFWPLLKSDFERSDKGNFIAWIVAIVLIGAIGYIPELRTISNLLLALVIVAFIFAALKQNPNLLGEAASSITAVRRPA